MTPVDTAAPHTLVHPAVAEAIRFTVQNPPELIDLLQIAMNPSNLKGQVLLTLEARAGGEIQPCEPFMARMQQLVMLVRNPLDFVLPLRVFPEYDTPASRALLQYSGAFRTTTVLFIPGNRMPEGPEVKALLDRAEFFREVRAWLKSNPDASRDSSLQQVETIGDSYECDAENRQLATAIVERLFNERLG